MPGHVRALRRGQMELPCRTHEQQSCDMFDYIVKTAGLDISPNMQLRVKDLIMGGKADYEAKVRQRGVPCELERGFASSVRDQH